MSTPAEPAAGVIGIVIRLSIGLVLLASAGAKLRNPDPFRTVVFLLSGPFRRAYKQLSRLAWSLEALTGAGLCLGVLRLGVLPVVTAALAVLLMLAFDGVLIALCIGHPGVACGCFGSRNTGGVTAWQLAGNAALTAAAIALLALTLRSR